MADLGNIESCEALCNAQFCMAAVWKPTPLIAPLPSHGCEAECRIASSRRATKS